MIVDADYILNSGLQISDDIRPETIELAIKTIETTTLASMMTPELYIELNESLDSLDDALVNGGILFDKVFLGLKPSIAHGVWAYLALDAFRITRYSTIEKESEYSTRSDKEQMIMQARRHFEIFQTGIDQICKFYGVESNENAVENEINTLYY